VVIYAASLNFTVAMEGLVLLDIIGGSRIAWGVSARKFFRLSIVSPKQEMKKKTYRV